MITYFTNSVLPSIEEVLKSDSNKPNLIKICTCKCKENADAIARILNIDESGELYFTKPRLNIALLESNITNHYQPGYMSIDQLTHLRTAFDYMIHILKEQKLISKEDSVHLCELNNKEYYKSIKRIAEGVEKLYE